MNIITELFQRKQVEGLPEPLEKLDYDEQKSRAEDPDPAVRADLALRRDIRPEILYFLASDDAPEVRQAIAANPATPVQADELLCQDLSNEVREDLAQKVARIIPNMPEDEQEKIRDMTVRVLYRLADDQLTRVRAILAEELKHTLKAPKPVIRLLAGDVEAIVAERRRRDIEREPNTCLVLGNQPGGRARPGPRDEFTRSSGGSQRRGEGVRRAHPGEDESRQAGRRRSSAVRTLHCTGSGARGKSQTTRRNPLPGRRARDGDLRG